MIEISKYFVDTIPGTLKIFTIDGIEFRTRYIPPGTFEMGATTDGGAKGAWWAPAHPVRITNGFYIMEDYVTEKQYYKTQGAENPILVTYEAAKIMASKLNKSSGETPKQIDENIYTGWRLPTEAEWEYCIKIDKNYNFTDEQSNANSGQSVSPFVSSLGLKNIIHAREQWCLDGIREYTSSEKPITNPFGNEKNKISVRGSERLGFYRGQANITNHRYFRLIKCV